MRIYDISKEQNTIKVIDTKRHKERLLPYDNRLAQAVEQKGALINKYSDSIAYIVRSNRYEPFEKGGDNETH